jgi:hypothetical protein
LQKAAKSSQNTENTTLGQEFRILRTKTSGESEKKWTLRGLRARRTRVVKEEEELGVAELYGATSMVTVISNFTI